ncbi:MAG: response regulator transcription factor [Bacillota bacterium]
MTYKILTVEDEASIRSFIKINLKRQGYDVVEARNGEEALDMADESISIAILDVMLPGIDGIEVCRRLRDRYPGLGIIMLTARGMEEDKIMGLQVGADDYMVKPFSTKELTARIASLLRRINVLPMQNAMQASGGEKSLLDLDVERRILMKGQTEIRLTPTEFAIIHLLMMNVNKAFSRDEILNAVWGKNYIGDIKTVDVNIRRLRQKLEDDPSNPVYIKTVWGHGYIWRMET